MHPVDTFERRFSEMIQGETYAVVADKTGLSKASVCAYVKGERTPKRPALMHIASIYKVDPTWLLGYDVPKFLDEKTTGPKAGIIAKVTAAIEDLPESKLEILEAFLEGLKER